MPKTTIETSQMAEVDSNWKPLLFEAAGLLSLYIILEWWIRSVAELPAASYDHPVLFAEGLRGFLLLSAGSEAVLQWIVLAVFVAAGIRFRHRFCARWPSLGELPALRVFIAVVAGVLIWAYGTYDFNLYANHGHGMDRTLLLLFFILLLWRPVFVLPFILIAVTLIWQFAAPIGPYSVAEQYALVRILILFVAALILYAVTGRNPTPTFFFIAITLVGASYLRCGVGKGLLSWQSHGIMNWATHGHVYYLLPATYANGWLGFLDPETMAGITRAMARFDFVLVGGTLVLEVAALFAFWRRKLMMFFLLGWALFHLGVFAVSGICFWKWIAVDLTLLVILGTSASRERLPIFTRSHFLLSIPLFLGGMFWFHPINLAWYDSPLSYTYRFVAVDEDGQRSSLPPQFFAPFDYAFTLGSFHYLSLEPGLNITWGAMWDRESAAALASARSTDDVEQIERMSGSVQYRKEKAAHLDLFLRRFIANYNLRGYRPDPFRRVQAPRQLWTFPREDTFMGESRIDRVLVYQVTSFFDGTNYEEFRTRQVRSIEIPRPEPESSS